MNFKVKIYIETCGLTFNGTPVHTQELIFEETDIESVLLELADRKLSYKVVKIEIIEEGRTIKEKGSCLYC